MPKRVVIVAVVAAVVAGAAAFALQDPDDDRRTPTLDEMARDIGGPVMELIHRGHVPGRSAEIFLVPKPHNFLIGEWDLTTLGSDTPTLTTSHPNPWNYLTRVPVVLWGPRWISHRVANHEPVDIAGLAPTYADLLGLEDFDAQGEILPDALIRTTRSRPKVIFTVVIDGGGWNTLQQHRYAWPTIERLASEGAAYYNATIGSAPSITGALHATFGTGSYPMRHGLPGNQMRDPEGRNVDTWLQNADPRYLRLPTVSELWDEASGNDAIVGTVSYEGWHLGMIGHGSQRTGGDKDIAALWEVDEDAWFINEDYYTLPDFLRATDLERLERYESELDTRDGIEDGTWFGHTLEELQESKVRPGTPAFVRFTGDAVVELLRSEPIGDDGVTDMIWVEMKMPDYAGHAWNMAEREQEDVLFETDRQIARFIETLDDTVGEDEYVFAVSADHGQQPVPDLHGGWRINNKELERDIEAEFGPIIEKISPVDIYIDHDAAEREDVDLAEVARWIAGYTLGENIPASAPGADRVPEGRLDEPLFAGAFPGDYLASLTADDLGSFGPGSYPEGVLTAGRGEQ